MNLVQFGEAVEARKDSWAVDTTIVMENERSDTDGLHEFIRLSVQQGAGFLDDITGIRTVDGSSVLHAFVLRFDVFTEINKGFERSNTLCQSILDHWQVKELGPCCYTRAGDIDTLGEDTPHFRQVVNIDGSREEFILAHRR